MRKLIAFRPIYLALAAAILAVEVAIAKGIIPGVFVRQNLGDVLVIALIYFFIRGVTRLRLSTALIASVTIGFVTEFLQYIHLVDRLGLQKGSVLYIVIGNTFSVMDLLMYLTGGLLAAGVDALLFNERRASI